MAGHDPELPAAQRPGGEDIVLVPDSECETSRQAHEVRRQRNPDREDLVRQRSAQRGHDDQGEEQGGKGHEHVGGPHDRGLDPASQDPGDNAERDTEPEAEDHRGKADLERDARTPDDTAEEVSTELVRSQEVPLDHSGPLEHGIGKLRRWAQSGDEGRPRGQDNHGQRHDDADADRRVTAQGAPARTARGLRQCGGRRQLGGGVAHDSHRGPAPPLTGK